MRKTVFDVGMYDGADSAYYLDKGFAVVAVEANPDLAAQAREKFSAAITSGQLTIENVAISSTRGPIQLHLIDDDLGSSTADTARLDQRKASNTVTVEGMPFVELIEKHGTPHYLKVDIEGLDGLCVRSLTAATRPAYVSFEMGDDALDLAGHLKALGYCGFKIISQSTFRQLGDHGMLFRVLRKVRHVLGRPERSLFTGDGRDFVLGHSSGPMGEATSGAWQPFDAVVRDWRNYPAGFPQVGGWFDLHARLNGTPT